MGNIELFVVIAFLVFGWLALIWKSSDFLNTFLKWIFSAMTIWALIIIIQVYLKTETDNLKAEQAKLQVLRNISTNSIPRIEK